MKSTRRSKKSIFVSSTFRDMQVERDALRDVVLPRVNEFAAQYGSQVELIDLRWGVDTASVSEAEQNDKVLRTCLDEIARSRPFFVGLLGDRYGWVPPDSAMTAALDFRGLPHDMLHKSVTALEIEYGVLRAPTPPVCLFYFRQSPNYALLPPEKQGIYQDSEEGLAQLAQLKAQLQKKMPASVKPYGVTLENGEIGGLESLCDMVTEDICAALRAEWGELPEAPPSWPEQEEEALDIFRESRVATFSGRRQAIRELKEFCLGDGSPQFLLLQGGAGSGKSGLLCKVMDEIEEDCLLLPFGCGITARASRVEGMLRTFIHRLATHLDVEVDPDSFDGFTELKDCFLDLLMACGSVRVVAVVDALDQLFPTEEARRLLWLSGSLPANFRVLASIIDGPEVEAMSRLGGEVRPIPSISDEDVAGIIRAIAAGHHKEITPNIVNHICAKQREDGSFAAQNPLYLSLLVQSLVMMDRYEHAIIDGYTAAGMTPIDAIERFMREMVDDVPGSPEGAYIAVQDRLAGLVGGTFVPDVLGLISASRHGLRESDLEGTLRLMGRPFNPADFSWLRQMLGNHFTRGDALQWDFVHQSLRRAQWHYHKQNVMALNGALTQYLLGIVEQDEMAQREIMHHLHIGANPRQAARLLGEVWGPRIFTTYAQALAAVYLEDTAAGEGADFLNDILENADAAPLENRGMITRIYRSDLLNFLPDSTPLSYKITLLEQAMKLPDPGNWNDCVTLVSCGTRLGVLYTQDGQTAEATRCLKRSVELAGELRDSSSDALIAYAIACGELAEHLFSLGEPEEAAEYLLEMLDAFEENHENSGNTKAKRYLAYGYSRVSSYLLDSGELEAASEYSEKGLAISHVIYNQSKSMEDLTDLATAQHNAGRGAVAGGDMEKAMALFAEELKGRRRVFENTGDLDSLRSLAVSTNNYGRHLRATDQHAAALPYFRETLEYTQEIYRYAPTTDAMRDLGAAHYQLEEALSTLKKYEEAWEHCQQALELYEQVYSRTGTVSDQQELSAARQISAKHLSRQGEGAHADQIFAQELSRQKAEYDRMGTLDSLRGLIKSNETMADHLAKTGRQEEALILCRENLIFAEDIMQATGGEEDKWYLVVALIQISDLLLELRREEETLSCRQREISLCRELYETTGHSYHLRRLALVNERMGDAQCAFGHEDQTVQYYRENADLSRRNTLLMQTLDAWEDEASAWLKLAEYLKKAERYEEAAEAYQEVVAVSRALLEEEETPARTHDLWICCREGGECYSKVKRFDSAMALYHEAAECAEVLYNPETALFALELGHNYYQICETAFLQRNIKPFRIYGEKMMKIWDEGGRCHWAREETIKAHAVLELALHMAKWLTGEDPSFGHWVPHFEEVLGQLPQ